MAAELGFSYTELREMPLPELRIVEEEAERVLKARKHEAAQHMQSMRYRGRGRRFGR